MPRTRASEARSQPNRKRTLDEEADEDGGWCGEGEEDEDWAASDVDAVRRKPRAKPKADKTAPRGTTAPRQPRAKKAKTAERVEEEEQQAFGQDEIYIQEEVWDHVLTGLMSTVLKTCMFRTWAHVAKDIASLALVCKKSSRAVVRDQWKQLESSCLKSIPSVPDEVLAALKIEGTDACPSLPAAGQPPASAAAAASTSAAAPAPAQDKTQDKLTAEEKGEKTMDQWMKVRSLSSKLSSDLMVSTLKVLLGGSGANWFKDFYLTHASYIKQWNLLNALLLPQPAALPEQSEHKGAPTAVKFEIRREGCRDRNISYGLSDATQTFLLTPKEVQEIPHHQEYRNNFAGTEVLLMDMWSQADLVRKALSKRSHEALKAELAAKEKRRQENALQRREVQSDTAASLRQALQGRWAHLPETYSAFLTYQSRLVDKNQNRCKGKDCMRIEALADYFTKRKGPDNQMMSEGTAMEVIERRAFLMQHDAGQSYRNEMNCIRQRGVNKKGVRLSDQEQAEAAALRAFLKQHSGSLASALALPHLPRHMHAAVRLAWPRQNQEPAARPAPEQPRTGPRHPGYEYGMYAEDGMYSEDGDWDI